MKQCGNFLIIANETKDPELIYSHRLEACIKACGRNASVISGGDYSEVGLIDMHILDGIDMVVVMGGDGTMLRVSHLLGGRNVPMIGVNLGTVGFLTEVVKEEIEDMVHALITGDYFIEPRMMLEADVYRGGSLSKENIHALNEVVIAREINLRLIALKIYVNGIPFDTSEADGVLISTPTGSTGYNLSAGGPIVNPSAKLLVMTPVSPYSLSRRSVVFGEEDRITLELVEKRKNSENSAIASFDGLENYRMQIGDRVEVRTSADSLQLVRLETTSVYETLRRKIGV